MNRVSTCTRRIGFLVPIGACALLFAVPANGDVAHRKLPTPPLQLDVRTTADAPSDRPARWSLPLPSIVHLAMAGAVPHPIAAPTILPGPTVSFDRVDVPREALGAVLEAAARTGVDPAYLCALADKESGWSTEARSSSSSAVGLFQFLEDTWLRMVKSHGASWGLADEAAAIAIGTRGARVADAALRSRILELRRNPWYAAVLAAEMLKRDRALVGGRLGREINTTEAYLAHFLGPAGAGRILSAGRGHARSPAARILPASARANRSLFYERKGRRMHPLGLAEFYGRVDRLIGARVRRYASLSAPALP
ncbi:transglycosylase SLT domain-containing protein [Methylorubrum extorquens]|uniref:Transglycosylase SLT domain-containing protein n=2 Tax=Methylorubrum extorquens TaxID=408 RepID=C5B3C8_METEA|nr:transglycosylase SLT domain-containing protein [Methylorubrum extorquens]ACS42960.1 Hypothetical protein MexAM1_META2p0022 [Methylorubrum extorquens AM1]EHP90961.1 Lytic transglycosylase catalytic [Methylorubrum extorquens DSM 13060]MCP1546002.1 hypothetical protein [Methylorubrum extorquens]MCP1590669.1 hypothetical protein [Methylorubrum extorquens]